MVLLGISRAGNLLVIIIIMLFWYNNEIVFVVEEYCIVFEPPLKISFVFVLVEKAFIFPMS